MQIIIKIKIIIINQKYKFRAQKYELITEECESLT